MISGFGGGSNNKYHHLELRHGSGLPIPFNLPNVLHNLLFEDVGLEFNTKQEDIIETLRFASKSLVKIQHEYESKEIELKHKILHESDNIELKKEYESIQLDRQQVNYDFKNLVELISDLLSREQFEKLLKFSNIAV